MNGYFEQLNTAWLGRDARFLQETESTNRDCDVAAAAGATEGVLISAEMQTAGRGRLGRSWFSPLHANLYFSVLLRPAVDPVVATTLPLVVGLAVAEALMEAFPALTPKIKWPNDIWIQGRKICGILCEMQLSGERVSAVIAGVGLNVNLTQAQFPEELRQTATALQHEVGHPLERGAVLAGIMNHLEPLYSAWMHQGFAPLAERIQRVDALFNQPLRMNLVGNPVEGLGAGIQADGALCIRTADGALKAVYSGEAQTIRTFD